MGKKDCEGVRYGALIWTSGYPHVWALSLRSQHTRHSAQPILPNKPLLIQNQVRYRSVNTNILPTFN